METEIRMVDLITQYEEIREEVAQAVEGVMDAATFINGPQVQSFTQNLSEYLDEAYVIPCANGTDALQIAMMALGLQPGDEVIVPAFTYVSTAEVVGLLGLTPVLIDVDPHTFTCRAEDIEAAISSGTKAIVPVHLFGQGCDMHSVMQVAEQYHLPVIEDAAQSIGARINMGNAGWVPSGTIGAIGCTSFFPSKNLGGFGDGGAMFTRSKELNSRLRMIANHGQSRRYYHDKIGVNSRLDSIQAAVLDIKLRHLDRYNASRRAAADRYDQAFAETDQLLTPVRAAHSEHVFHQYTLKVTDGSRDQLKEYLQQRGIPAMIYYPVPLHRQKAFQHMCKVPSAMTGTETLCDQVISLPMHSELTPEIQDRIINGVLSFYSV